MARDIYDPRINFGVLHIDQVKIAIPNVSQARADKLSEDLNLEIRKIVDAFVRALTP